MTPGCGFDWMLFLEKYGIAGLLIVGGGLFFWKEGWPTFKNFLAEIVLQLKSISALLAEIAPALKALIEATKDHEANTKQALNEIRAIAAKSANRRTTK